MANDAREQVVKKPYPPLGLLYLSAWLEHYGFENEVFDTTFSNQNDQRNFIVNFQPNIIAIYTNLMTKIEVIQLIEFIQTSLVQHKPLIVVGGPDVTYNIDNYLHAGADILVIGEGEKTILEICQAHQQGLWPDFYHIDGLAFRDQAGRAHATKSREKIDDLDVLPLPNRSKIDIGKYLDIWKTNHGHSSISVSTQRGCPYTCKWCSTAVYGQSYRRRSPAKVVEELMEIKRNYHPDNIWFVDDVFTVSHIWLKAFRDEVLEKQAVVPFECITRADRLNEEAMMLLKEAGCFRVWIGAESGSQKILDAMDRRVDATQVQQMIRLANAKGIETGTFIMVGYPGENDEDIVQTLHHLKSANPDIFTITITYPIKGTALDQEVEAIKKPLQDWKITTDRQSDFLRTYPSLYYKLAVRWIINSMALHKGNPKGKFSIKLVSTALKIIILRLGMKSLILFGTKEAQLHSSP